jgi:hypothetical protein
MVIPAHRRKTHIDARVRLHQFEEQVLQHVVFVIRNGHRSSRHQKNSLVIASHLEASSRGDI